MLTDSPGASAFPVPPAFSRPGEVHVGENDVHFEQLLAAHGGSIRRLCMLYENDVAERDDLLQDIAFAIWKALPSFRGECSEKTFVYRIAYNRALSHRFKRHLPAVSLSAADEIADPSANPAIVAEQASERERLQHAVRQLPENLREPVVLRLEGLSDREIADVLGLTEGNVAVRLTRARHALRAVLLPNVRTDQP